MSRVVLVTGVSRFLGGRMAAQLAADPRIDTVIGVDVIPSRALPEGVHFVRADIRNPIIGKVMASEQVDTVVHMGVIATPRQAGGRSVMKEINVIGTMQLLAACQQTERLQHVIVKSTAMVYGSGPKDPAMFTEDMDPRHAPRTGWAKDSIEVENYVRGFARRRPNVRVTTFRFANFIGPHVQTAMTSYFELPVIPTVLGFDARLQFISEDDGLDVIHHSVHDPVPGTFNIAGDGVMMLSQSIRRLGRPQVPIPEPLLATVGRAMGGLADFTAEQVRYLAYGRALDTSAGRNALGWKPGLTSAEAFESYAYARHPNAPVLVDHHD
jgi:UDP-glucose 4-epimerase